MEFCLVGVDGNAYSIMGYVRNAMKKVGFSKDEIETYLDDAMSDDYHHLLQVSAAMVDKCNEVIEHDRLGK